MTQSLFTAATANTISDPAIDAAYATRPDLYNLYARAKHGVPEVWRWFQISCGPEDAPKGMAKLQGAIYQTGKRGKLSRVKGTEQTLFIVMDDVRTFDRDQAKQAGKCCRCWGTGMKLVGSSNDKRLYRKCTDCGGTGKPAVERTP